MPVQVIDKQHKQLLSFKWMRFLQKEAVIPESQQQGLLRLNVFDLFIKPDFGYNNDKMDIGIVTENNVLDHYQCCRH